MRHRVESAFIDVAIPDVLDVVVLLLGGVLGRFLRCLFFFLFLLVGQLLGFGIRLGLRLGIGLCCRLVLDHARALSEGGCGQKEEYRR